MKGIYDFRSGSQRLTGLLQEQNYLSFTFHNRLPWVVRSILRWSNAHERVITIGFTQYLFYTYPSLRLRIFVRSDFEHRGTTTGRWSSKDLNPGGKVT